MPIRRSIRHRRRPFILGLTGSIGMGKSAVAAMFRRERVPLFDADAAVHRMQGPNGTLLSAIEARFPGTNGPAGVDRASLGRRVLASPTELAALEAIIHPAVAREQAGFLARHRFRRLVVLDIPLLFEMGGVRKVDAVAVVSAPLSTQRQRVLARPGMTAEKLDAILRIQLPDHIKRRRADFVIPTGCPKSVTRRYVHAIASCFRRR